MEAQQVSINGTFVSNHILKIPFFQRPYVWDVENWEKFYNDIADIAMTITEGGTPEIYFMGSIILKQTKNNQFDVIDGQQRLTTIVLFMKALYLCIGNNGAFITEFMRRDLRTNTLSPILTPNHNDRITYNNIIEMEFLRTEPINDTKMAEAYAYFAKRILDSRNGVDEEYPIDPFNLHDAAVNYVNLISILVGENENAQRIFDTINSTGIKLTTGEMLKNYLYDETRVNQYEQTWKRVFEGANLAYWNDDIVLGRLESNHIKNFFYRYMLIKMQEPGIKENLTPAEIKSYRKQDGLFEKFKKLIEKNHLSINDMITDVTACARLYKDTFKSDIIEEALTRNPGIQRLVGLMFAQDAWTMTPYILYILKNQNSESERNRIFGYMETYLLRRIFCKSKNNNYSDLFSENLIGQRVNTYDAFRNYVNDVNARGALLMPSDNELRVAINNEDQKRNAKVLLYMFESKFNQNFTTSEYTNGFNDFEIEQVMPENNNSGWATNNYTDEDRERLTRTIGNFVLLRGKLKSADKRALWNRKKIAMAEADKAKDIITSTILTRELPNWTEETIVKRNEWFAKKAIELWPL